MDFDINNILENLNFNKNNSFKSILEDNIKIEEILKSLSKLNNVQIFSSLLLCPEMQSNCLRLEAIIHLIMSISKGENVLNENSINKLFKLMKNTSFGYGEDPIENVFTSLVYSKKDNYKILEGIWVDNSFYLQRFLNILNNFPDSKFFNNIKNCSYALLRLSDKILNRLIIDKYIVGNTIPRQSIPKALLNKMFNFYNCLKFTDNDLKEANINPSYLKPFLFNLEWSDKILDEEFGSTTLERYPLIYDGIDYIMILPTAIGICIRRYIIETLNEMGYLNSLWENLAISYSKHFKELPILGELTFVPICFNKIKNFMASEMVTEIDTGRYLHLLFILDNFIDFNNGWFSNCYSNNNLIGKEISTMIMNTINQFKDKNDFKNGITLIIGCGWGRFISFPIQNEHLDFWKIELISASDLTTISLLPNFNVLSLWRLFEAVNFLQKENIQIVNPSGILNLYSWAKTLNYHLVPHQQFIDDSNNNPPNVVLIEQNSLLESRKEVLSSLDEQILENSDGDFVRIRKRHANWYFKEDKNNSIYICFDEMQNNKFLSVIKGNNINWWCKVDFIKGEDKKFLYSLQEAINIWLNISNPILDKYFSELKLKNITWHLLFESIDLPENRNELFNEDELKKFITISCNNKNLIKTTFSPEFIIGFLSETNIAERIIIWSFIKGIEKIIDKKLNENEIESLLDKIIPNKWAKNIHFFMAKTYRDYVASSLQKHTLINKFDDSTMRIGLGWSAYKRTNNFNIKGIVNCNRYLNNLIDVIWLKIKDILKKYDREKIITILLNNYESISYEKERWEKTIKSMLSFHKNKSELIHEVSDQIFKFNGAILGSRIAIEMALCESPLNNDKIPGNIEISKLITYASIVFNFGNISNAIFYEAMEPEIKISPFGDVLLNLDFIDEVIQPYGNYIEKNRLKDKSNDYYKLYKNPKIIKPAEKYFQKEFIDSWNEEFQFSIDDGRLFIDILEDYGIKFNSVLYKLKYNDLLNILDKIEINKIENIINALCLYPRESWDKASSDFKSIDWEPWRFRRQLSLLRKPLIQLDLSGNPEFLIAPGLIREGYIYLLRGSYEGELNNNQFKTQKMRKWIGSRENERGHKFNKTVSNKLHELDWNIESDLKLTKILNMKLDKDYGDIDVLAWRKTDNRVLLIECKDLEFAKTHGEIALQIREFKGQINKKGKPDRLKKHLDRVEILKKNEDQLSKYINMQGKLQIETHLIFNNIVPVVFLTKNNIIKNIKVSLFKNIKKI